MSAKDFSQVNADPVFNTIDTVTDEKPKRGRKKEGDKVQMAINISTEARDYIETMAVISQNNYSKFIDRVLLDHKAENIELYKGAKKIIEKFNQE